MQQPVADHKLTPPIESAQGRKRWIVLAVIAIAQFMVVLDLTVMNIALPSAQRALHFATADRQWVVTAYTLAFGSLLLAGGRLADILGRKVTFLVGLVGFAGVSAVGGASVNFAMLVTARACQGAFANKPFCDGTHLTIDFDGTVEN
jgi:MFS family permease